MGPHGMCFNESRVRLKGRLCLKQALALTLNMDDLSVQGQIADYDYVMGHFRKALSRYEAILSGLETDENAASYWRGLSLLEIKLNILWCLVRTHRDLDEKNQAAKYLKPLLKTRRIQKIQKRQKTF